MNRDQGAAATTSDLWRIEMLGGLRACQGEHTLVRFRTQKAGALLAYLAYHTGQRHARESLVTMLWPDREPAAGHHSLRMALLSLRHQLEPPGVPPGAVLVADRETIGLNTDAVATDVAQFRDALKDARFTTSAAARHQHLCRAVALYQGPLLPACYEDWVAQEREQLNEEVQHALRAIMEAREHSKDLAGALEYARRAVALDPLREEAHRDVMRLCALTQRPDAAARQYRELERLLARELGVRPEVATRELAERIRVRRRDASRANVAPPRPLPAGDTAAATPAETDDAPPPRTLTLGTITFLLMEARGDLGQGHAPADAWAEYHVRIRPIWERHSGSECRGLSSCCTIAFARSCDALECALACQTEALRLEAAGHAGFRVAMALHTGDADSSPRPDDEGGVSAWSGALDVLQGVERILAVAHPGQVLCSEQAAVLLRRRLRREVRLVGLGVFRLPGSEIPEHLFQVSHDVLPVEPFPPPRADTGCHSNLPPQTTRFIGRNEETSLLCESLLSPDARLVTVTGPGGCGKTRLAVQAAARLAAEARATVCMVNVAGVTDPAQVERAVLDALNIAPPLEGAPLEQTGHLPGHRAVLVLDGFEQLVPGGLPLITRLLAEIPSITCLVTSRRRLGLVGERLLLLAGLPAPQSRGALDLLCQCPSVQLFVDRAQMVRPDFQVTRGNAEAIADLCTRVEGMPLAIELLAARVQALAPRQMLDRLDENLDWKADRRLTGDERHTSLRATVDWSHQLLSPERQRLFARFSVFRGGWSLEAAERLSPDQPAGSVLEGMVRLQQDSLVVLEEALGELRFRMQESVRAYAAECLEESGDAVAVHRRHAQIYLALVQRAEPHLRQVGTGAAGGYAADAEMVRVWLERLTLEQDNLRAALEWSLTATPLLALRLAVGMLPFWEARGQGAEGHILLEKALSCGVDVPRSLRVQALNAKERLAHQGGQLTA